MKNETTEEIYSALQSVWPDNNRWYNYTHTIIQSFTCKELHNKLHEKSLYLNAGSGGSTYELPGICYHVDIVEKLITTFPHHIVASIEELPFPNNYFDCTICVGSVINYCDAVQSIAELSRTLKVDGYMVLEFERSNTGELWGTHEYGKGSTIQKYEYLGHTHTLWLYSERLITSLLRSYGFVVLKRRRFHCLSAIVNGITKREEPSGRFACFDKVFYPFSYFAAHNVIMLCQKAS